MDLVNIRETPKELYHKVNALILAMINDDGCNTRELETMMETISESARHMQSLEGIIFRKIIQQKKKAANND